MRQGFLCAIGGLYKCDLWDWPQRISFYVSLSLETVSGGGIFSPVAGWRVQEAL